MVKKKQKVRFHKGDKRPNSLEKKLKYKVEMAKEGKKILLDNITVLDDNKALLTYKTGKSYYTKTINYRRGEIKPIDYVVIGPYV